jgi:hypothetical protein
MALTIIAVLIEPSNFGAHFPVRLGTGLMDTNLYFAMFCVNVVVVAVKCPYLPKNMKSSLKCQYPNISRSSFLSFNINKMPHVSKENSSSFLIFIIVSMIPTNIVKTK